MPEIGMRLRDFSFNLCDGDRRATLRYDLEPKPASVWTDSAPAEESVRRANWQPHVNAVQVDARESLRGDTNDGVRCARDIDRAPKHVRIAGELTAPDLISQH